MPVDRSTAQRLFRLTLTAGCCALVFAGALFGWEEYKAYQHRVSVQQDEAELIAAGDDDHINLRAVMDSAGMENPEMAEIDSVDLPDATRVIGIEVHGSAACYVIDAMVDESKHIINTVIEETPVSITYCPLVDCARVLTLPAGAQADSVAPIKLRLGGLDSQNQMVFKYGNARYGQSSTKLPLSDVPHESSTLGEWKRLHPDSKVFRG